MALIYGVHFAFSHRTTDCASPDCESYATFVLRPTRTDRDDWLHLRKPHFCCYHHLLIAAHTIHSNVNEAWL